MFCPECGKSNFDNLEKCAYCGADLIDSTIGTGSAPNDVNGPHTPDTPQNLDELFPDLQTMYGSDYTPSNDKKKVGMPKIPMGVIIGVIVAVVLIVAAALLIPKFIGGKEQPGTTEPIPPQPPTPTEDVINKIDDDRVYSIIDEYTQYTEFGIYVHNLNNNYEYGYNEDSVFLASAMGQVVILDTLSSTVGQMNLSVDHEELYFEYMPNGKESPTSQSEDGSFVSIKKCVEDVAVYGDNNKSNHLVDYIGDAHGYSSGFDVINNMLRSNGYYNTEINRKTFTNSKYIDMSASPNITTPRDIGIIFENLINNSNLGSKNYMKNIFKSVSNDGQAIGLKKFVPSYYDVYNVNALTSQCTNNVAIIEDGETEVVVAILSTTNEEKTKIEDNTVREKVLKDLVDYIIETQFENQR